MQDPPAFLEMNEPIHVVVTSGGGLGASPGSGSVLGTLKLEWRHALVSGAIARSVEVLGPGPGPEDGVPIGLIQIRIEILPTPDEGVRLEHVEQQVSSTALFF
jgi:hypothetical protein